MRIAFFDTFSGISGDMVLGAFINAGLPLDALKQELLKLPLRGYEIVERKIVRSMITATKIDVLLHGEDVDSDVRTHSHSHRHHHSHEHEHEYVREDHHHDEQRSYAEIVSLIGQSELKQSVKKMSEKIFRVIARAEAKIHDVPVDGVHFHEVGAVDSIVDIVGIALCIDKMGIEKIYSTPIRTGSGGFVKTQHGMMPIPTPATMEILKNYPTVLTDIPHELTTPTGAGFIAALSNGVLPLSHEIQIESIGYGVGGMEIPHVPNLLRVMIGELIPSFEQDELLSIETNIDDMNPEVYPYLIEKLFGAGAHDVYLIPIIMKKGRPGILLSCMCAKSAEREILQIMYSETTTLGVRVQPIARRKLPREIRTVQTSFGPIAMKVVVHDGEERFVPEFEECKRIAQNFSLPLIEVYRRIEKEIAH